MPDHLDRLSSVDASFLHAEDTSPAAHMHIGGLAIFEGPAPSGADLRAHVASRLPLLPRFRQRLVPAPFGTGRPLWADDPSFSLSYHVRHSALPSPGSEEQLLTFVSRITSQRLDRSKPLWEMYLVEGLDGGRWALVTKTHHAMVDGVSGVDLLTALVDLTPESRTIDPDTWTPMKAPGTVGLLARGVTDGARTALGIGQGVLARVTHPERTVAALGRTLSGFRDLGGKVLGGAPPSPLNGPVTPHRQLAVARTDLEDYKRIKSVLGGSVNDTVIAVVAGALRTWLDEHGHNPDDLPLRALVPVSVRSEEQKGALGNQITVLVAPLPVQERDPVQRLAAARTTMDGLKRGTQAVAARAMTRMEDFLPPTVLAQASRLSFSSRLFNLLVTNVPGPQFPVYVLGRKLIELVPLAFLAPQHRLAIAIVSYDGSVVLGLLGDRDGVPDLDGLAKGIEVALAELVDAAGAADQAAADG
ncbi:MAG TPA: wax ester/triacylglycerol synthase family O-acyltransferase [Mycobacteriales bacterium]|nr:wax ester/triacylglycerol synthase family O-acyltransferase [Mycobacteriales bacterium]